MTLLENAKIKLGDGSKISLMELVEFYQDHQNGARVIEDATGDKAARSSRYGISVVEGKPVTKPSRWSSLADSQWGDPVNYAYPVPDVARARSAISRFNAAGARAAGGYSEADWDKIGGRLARLVGGKLGASYEFVNGKLKRKAEESEPIETAEVWIRGSEITSFADLQAANEAEESAYRIQDLTGQYTDMVWNIMRSPLEENKPAALQRLTAEFIALLGGAANGEDEDMESSSTTIEQERPVQCLCPECDHTQPKQAGVPCRSTACEECGAMMVAKIDESVAPSGDNGTGAGLAEKASVTTFSEGATGTIIEVVEAEGVVNTRSPLTMEIALIQPGFGNRRDNHYYSAEMLKRDAPLVFPGVKMYLTDHKPGEKSVRTEVSRVKEIVGFANGLPNVIDGTPIAKVSAFEPGFCEMVRNRAAAGELDSLECSILASGIAKKGTVDGKSAKVVESITTADSVDWVTRAGAGGRALSISENEEEPMENRAEHKEDETEKVEESETVDISEQDDTPGTPEPADGDNDGSQEADTSESGHGPILLTEQQVVELVDGRLPEQVVGLFAERDFEDAEQVNEAVTRWQESFRELTGSGAPRGHGSTDQPNSEPMTEAEWKDRLDAIDKAHGLI